MEKDLRILFDLLKSKNIDNKYLASLMLRGSEKEKGLYINFILRNIGLENAVRTPEDFYYYANWDYSEYENLENLPPTALLLKVHQILEKIVIFFNCNKAYKNRRKYRAHKIVMNYHNDDFHIGYTYDYNSLNYFNYEDAKFSSIIFRDLHLINLNEKC